MTRSTRFGPAAPPIERRHRPRTRCGTAPAVTNCPIRENDVVLAKLARSAFGTRPSCYIEECPPHTFNVTWARLSVVCPIERHSNFTTSSPVDETSQKPVTASDDIVTVPSTVAAP